MKKVIMMLTGMMLVASQNVIAQNNMKLSERQQALVAIAANEARGNITQLKVALNDGLDH